MVLVQFEHGYLLTTPSDARHLAARLEATADEVEEEAWTCPGCLRSIEPSDVRRHAAECEKYDGRHGY